MNKLLANIERKIGKYAIHNLSLYIIIAYIIGYALALTGTMDYVSLNPYYIFNKWQIWRIISWVLVPPSGLSFFTIIMLFVYYQLGSTLESTWGAFRYNVYIFSGLLFTVIGALILYFVSVANGYDPEMAGYIVSTGFSTYYINLSIFLAFATVYPNMQMLLFFIIPVKIKWLAYFDVALLIYEFIFSGTSAKIAIVMSLLNFIVFFFTTRNYKSVSPQEIHRRRQFQRNVNNAERRGSDNSPFTKHKCAVCGRTENDGDNLEFRFCSKCNGNYEYCSDHLFTHEHKK